MPASVIVWFLLVAQICVNADLSNTCNNETLTCNNEEAELSGNIELPLPDVTANSQTRYMHYDFSKQPKDPDGVPQCPSINPGTSPWEYMVGAFHQAKSFHTPTNKELAFTQMLLSSLKSANIAAAMNAANEIDLQTCRNENNGDSYVIMITKPGVTTYVGPFYTYREKGASPLVMQDGHVEDCNSGDYPQTLFQNTHSVLAITNGYPRALAGDKTKTCWGAAYQSDGTHNANNLFYHANVIVANLWPNSVFFHWHGMAKKGVIITNSLGFNVGQQSLLYAFTKELKAVLQPKIDKDPAYLDNLRVCAPGTVLRNMRCQIVATWIEGRYMTRSKDPACGNGHQNTNRWIGLEQGPEIRYNPRIMTKVLLNLEDGYLKGEKVN